MVEKKPKKSKKVLPITGTKGPEGPSEYTPPEYQDLYPQDDPRSSMSKEEMIEFERQEQAELERRMNRFIKDTPQPITDGIDHEDEETFTLDLSTNKIIKVETEGVAIVEAGTVENMLAVVAAPLKPLNPYAEVLTDVFVSKALGELLGTLSSTWDRTMEAHAVAPTKDARNAIIQGVEAIEKQQDELKRAWIRGTAKVNYDKIPEWAENHIRDFIEDRMKQLLELTSGD